MNFKETQLPNGLRVATSQMSHVESVAMAVWVGVGGRSEPKRLSGVSHFIEHLLFKGTTTRSAKEISQAIEGRGGYFNAFTQEESTCYYARIAAPYAWEVLDVLCDMYARPKVDLDELDRERGVIIEEIMMYRDQPHHLVQEMLGELLWDNHPLGRPLAGTPAIISRISRSEILDFKKSRYIPSNTLVVFAGKVDHDECVREVARRLGRTRARACPAVRKVDRKVGQKDVDIVQHDFEQGHLAIGYRLFGRHDRRKYALKLLSVMLGENMSSRLFQVVRERHGLAYSVHSSVQLFKETGVLAIQAGLDRKRVARSVDLIFREIRRFRDRPVGAAELRRAKDYAIGQLQIGLESTTSHMTWIGENLMGYDGFTQPTNVVKRIETVTAAKIHEVARQVLQPGRCSVAGILPEKPEPIAEHIRARLAAS